MSKLIYFIPTSLDGFIADETQSLDWSAPNDEVMSFINDLMRPLGTYLFGRKNYETMTVWETPGLIPGLGPSEQEFARIWQAAEKIIYSRTLKTVSTPRTRLEREFSAEAIRDLKTRSPHDLAVAGPNLAAQAIQAGLVDEYHLLVMPALLGHGKRVLPDNGLVKLKLLDERRFADGTVYLRYQTR